MQLEVAEIIVTDLDSALFGSCFYLLVKFAIESPFATAVRLLSEPLLFITIEHLLSTVGEICYRVAVCHRRPFVEPLPFITIEH